MSASAAGLVGCGSDKVTIGPQDAAAGRDAPAGASGGRATGGVTGAGGVAATGGIAGATGTIGAGGVTGTGGTSTTGKTCGGFAGLACAAGEICEIPPGHCCCDYSGTCAVRPQGCTTIYQPVCGCDGKTYGNDCARQVAGVSKNLDGACPATDAGAGGGTGTGGTTAGGGTKGSGGATGVGGSKGSGGATGVGGSSGGATGTGGATGAGGAMGTGGAGGSTGKTCGGRMPSPCAANEICDATPGFCDVADMTGTCVVKPQVCGDVYHPVCGCNGATYSNDCERQAAGMSKNFDGACPAVGAFESFRLTQSFGPCPSGSDCVGYIDLDKAGQLLRDQVNSPGVPVGSASVTPAEVANAIAVFTDPALVKLLDASSPPCVPPTDIFEDMKLVAGGVTHQNTTTMCDNAPVKAARDLIYQLGGKYLMPPPTP